MKHWSEYSLSELCSNITDGKHGDCQNEKGSGYYFVSVKDAYDGKIHYENSRQITKKDFEETHRRTQLEANDILITNSGTIGRMVLVKKSDLTEKTTFQKSVAIIKPVSEKVVSVFLYYYLLSEKKRLCEFAGGTTQKNLLLRDLKSFKVMLPDKKSQVVISNILKCLDDKIECNNRMNKVLEEIARALFHRWFVEFEFPNADGKPYLSAGGKMVESEMGRVPEGWHVGTLDTVIDIIGGGTPKTTVNEYWSGDIPWFSVVDAPNDGDIFVLDTEKHITQLGVENSSTRLLPIGTTIISARGTVGKLAVIGVPMAMNQSCYGIRGKNDGTDYFVYFVIRSLVYEFQLKGHGSVFNTITRTTINSQKVIIPDISLINKYNDLVTPLFQKIQTNLKENRNMSKIRDSLLPELMSGKLEFFQNTIQTIEPGIYK